ncbi:5'-methylthioadenosine/adenosylhomocysteine nucleosidase [Evansella sp. AB-P1]|uniref:5'-methylthioadenosine/adenosylhomocysteine nucleosidase n=1 Tax=Evansella sp. AB-P1 TaxID=3037653 RepID=UPI00242009C7|nr:5'-methylthioadenosine/adenosylhomocysteine nucleosidase [Evansella sp. AB-P1]MDG5787027.1 5'-methylthioadenosine/adenosylhomocysteine nucleosidase [Evansella sp. AB-P1]
MRLGIIGAMREEVSFFLEEAEGLVQEKKGNITFHTGIWQNHDVVICQCGVGKVNAAMTAQILIDVFNVKGIIFTGVAGALDERLDVGDIVISTSCQEHDIDASPLGFEKGKIPMYDGTSVFPADETLIQKAYTAANNYSNKNVKVEMGKIVSGDQFIANKSEVKQLREQFNALCVEMEGAALGHVANFNNIPFVVIRSISDNANGEAPESFESFVVKVANQSSKIVEGLLKLL